MRSLPDLPSEKIIDERLNNGYQIVPSVKGKETGSIVPPLQTHKDLEQVYKQHISLPQQQLLISQYT